MTPGIAQLTARLAVRDADCLTRTRKTLSTAQGAHVTVDGRACLAFASNDYLGLAADPRVVAALCDGAGLFGAGAGASHVVSGHQAPHAALEAKLADYVQPTPGARCLTLSSGYLANLAILGALANRESEIHADRLNHACLNDGALLARARLLRYPHVDMAALRARLAASRAKKRLIVTDAVFSMDGDVAPLAEMLALAEQFDAWLVIDDAHGFGVLGHGRGSLAEAGLTSERIVYMGTLGKAAGVSGAFICAHPAVIETILQTARAYIYTTAAPAALAAALLQSVAIIEHDPVPRMRLLARIAQFRAAIPALGLRTLPSRTAIQSIVVGGPAAAAELSARLWDAGILVPAIRPPTVPRNTSRLRVSLSAAHSEQDVERLIAALRE
ncbi:MAG: 8-amino-7-oxononanoate synthase [Casimicrobiaceae bacterium]